MVTTSGLIPIGVAAILGIALMKSGKNNLTLVSAALALITLWFVIKGKG